MMMMNGINDKIVNKNVIQHINRFFRRIDSSENSFFLTFDRNKFGEGLEWLVYCS